MQINFKMQLFRLEAIIFKKLSQKVRMPVTEHNSTLKIAFVMGKNLISNPVFLTTLCVNFYLGVDNSQEANSGISE